MHLRLHQKLHLKYLRFELYLHINERRLVYSRLTLGDRLQIQRYPDQDTALTVDK